MEKTKKADPETLMRSGRWDDAVDALNAILAKGKTAAKAKALELLEKCAEHSTYAATTLALALLRGDSGQTDLDRGVALLREVLQNDDETMHHAAHFFLAYYYLGIFGGPSDAVAALGHFEEGGLRGNAESAYCAGLLLQNGMQNITPDIHRAMDNYARAADEDHPKALTNLALLVAQEEEDFETAMDLLEEAAELGDKRAKKAMRLLRKKECIATDEHLARATRENGVEGAPGGDAKEDEEDFWQGLWNDLDKDAGSDEDIEDDEPYDDPGPRGWRPGDPPVRILMKSVDRPRLVADAIRKRFGISKTEAENSTALIYGYGSWNELVQTTKSVKIADLEDEKADAETVLRRFGWQVHALQTAGGLDEFAAETAIRLLKPSAAEGTPSLDKLDEAMGSRLFPISSNELTRRMADYLRGIGIDPGANPMAFLDSLRAAGPMRADVWIAFLEQHLGWTLEDTDPEAQDNGARFAVAVGPDGTRIPMFLSPIGYSPGDRADIQADKLKRRIRKTASLAILMFNRPLVWIGREMETSDAHAKGLLYGGLILRNGVWSDFVLRPGGGLVDALSQTGFPASEPTEDFIDRFGFEGADSFAMTIAAYQHDLDPTRVTGTLLSQPNGWAHVFVMPDRS
jgi:tetratricopeptide (TPR) repeat protein